MKLIGKFILIISSLFIFAGCDQHHSSTVSASIVAPLEHEAMSEAAIDFTHELKASLPEAIKIQVQSERKEINLQRALIQQMRVKKVALTDPDRKGLKMTKDDNV